VVRRFPWFPWLIAGLLVLAVTGFHLLIDFRGLTEPAGMEQAQAARELARSGDLGTKMHRPLALAKQMEWTGDEAPHVAEQRATFFGPLNPLLNAAALKMSGWEFGVDSRYRIYFPDRVIASVSMLCFLGAVAVAFLLTSRLFDTRIAVATVAILLVSEIMWRFTQSGLAQMLGMLLLMLGLWGLVSALERWRIGKVPLFPLLGAALCFGALVLALPVAIGVAAGAVLFVGLMFRRRALLPLLFGIVCGGVVLLWMLWNFEHTGNLFGTSVFGVFESYTDTPGSRVMRTYDPGMETLPDMQVARKMWRVATLHVQNFWGYIGGNLAVPLFLLSFLCPFRNPEAARLRWGILMMWIGAGLGMTILGTPRGALDPNQLHVLFVPMATAFGLTLLTVLWEQVPLAQNPFSLWRNAHLIAAVALSAVPLLAELPARTLEGARFRNRVIEWPPYDPAAITFLKDRTREDELIFSDIPWAVAWYADRHAVWLPTGPDQVEEIAAAWEADGGRVAGIYLTPKSLNGRLADDVMNGDFREWSRVMMRGQVMRFGMDLFETVPDALRHWTRLSPSRKDEAWFISREPLRREVVAKGLIETASH